jgi:beta-glucanase (GH16 family)
MNPSIVWGGSEETANKPFFSTGFRPRIVVKTVSIVIVATLLYFSTVSLAVQKSQLNLPASWNIFSHDDGTVKMVAKQTAELNHWNPNMPWTYDFSGKKDGPVNKHDFNFEEGTTVADYNGELQAYTSRTSNVRIENGLLVLTARQENYDGKKYTSARLNTYGGFEFTYGTLEVDMKVPEGRGTWPAAWLLPANNRYKPTDYGISPKNDFAWAVNGEVDFAESVGNIPDQVIPAIHSYNEVQRKPTYTPGIVPNAASEFHRYGVIKTPTAITFTIDGRPYASRHKTSNNPLEWPYDQPYYLVLNLAIGGHWAGNKGVDNSLGPWQLQLRSIKYTPMK